MHINWDQLQTVEALVRLGTLDAAASELGLRHTTVSRRVDGLEQSLGAALFTRGARLLPTPLALEIAAQAAPMREQAERIGHLAARLRRVSEARVTITTSDVLAPLLLRALTDVELPRQVEVVASDRVEALSPGAVDLALRPSYEPGGALKGRRIGVLAMGVYRARGGDEGWVLPSETLRAKASMRWWQAVPDDAQGKVVCDSLLAMRDACIAGLGRAILPCFLAHGDPRLERERGIDGGTPLWFLSPATRSADAALRALSEALVAALQRVPDAWVERARRGAAGT
jgi:DNA-binding transcriptional LysR family regulator